ncbi:Rne/Rng family ribonuclease [Alphaproteobacteria bacterium]|nr:Rne/Rng family ribonuclease [Alphaproteobacteria bacterium]
MTKRMLIDATHAEETRVAVVSNQTIESFDFETFQKENLRGNVYLAKIVRVEPSLQAAFVDYGADRHGFLPFSEIHPDYFRIPVQDREALAKKVAQEREEVFLDDEGDLTVDGESSDVEGDFEIEVEGDLSAAEKDISSDEKKATDKKENSADTTEGKEEPSQSPYRRYKIQEVVSKGQIILIQVVKEERGQKGAAMTSYLSLAGRYCVLMPNSRKGGGISRKISNPSHRKRLKGIVESLEIADPMGLIIRTAGQERTKAELKRDCEYLKRLWNDIRDKTMESIAPALINQEGDLIQKSIRDTYSKEIDEILVQGERGYTAARAVMKTFMPSHARRIKEYKEKTPLLTAYHVDSQIEELYEPEVRLPSGGSIVISPTEALTAIDINSGRSTKDRHIDDTAFRTNVEAAQEICRQLRLRDVAGLVVIDFIDMENKSHIATVEKTMKEALEQDRARIQVGRISQFGLLELSRQRLRPSFFESIAHTCPHCAGRGLSLSIEAQATRVLRLLDKQKPMGGDTPLRLLTTADVVSYILNAKRKDLIALEEKHAVSIEVVVSDKLDGEPCQFEGVAAPRREGRRKPDARPPKRSSDQKKKGRDDNEREKKESADGEQESGQKRRRNRRRGPRKDESRTDGAQAAAPAQEGADKKSADKKDAAPAQDRSREQSASSTDQSSEPTDGKKTNRRRRSRGRRKPDAPDGDTGDKSSQPDTSVAVKKQEKGAEKAPENAGSGEEKGKKSKKGWLNRILSTG